MVTIQRNSVDHVNQNLERLVVGVTIFNSCSLSLRLKIVNASGLKNGLLLVVSYSVWWLSLDLSCSVFSPMAWREGGNACSPSLWTPA